MRSLIAASFPLLFLAAAAAPQADEVTSLPGWEKGPLPAKMWSGYVEISTPTQGSMSVHYVLVQNAAGRPDAKTVAWHNGGPGSSAMIGFLTENGPVTMNDDSFTTAGYNKTGVPTVFRNPFSWHSEGNILYVDHPAPVGFSYCAVQSSCKWDDSSQGVAMRAFYAAFFASYFPELAGNEFYITGESYAGVMVPMGVLDILNGRNASNREKAPWSIKGIALGNDCAGSRLYTCTPYSGWAGTGVALDFRYYHGMVSEETYRNVTAACAGQLGKYEPPSEPCRSMLEDPIDPLKSQTGSIESMGGGYYLYDTCPLGDSIADIKLDASKPPYDLNSGVYACGQERAGIAWLNRQDVQKALHVKLVGKDKFNWGTGLDYDKNKYSLLQEYASTLAPGLRVLQYSGDADPCVPYVGTQRWIDSLNFTASKPWHPWSASASRAPSGYAVRYTGTASPDFTFATVRGAGHMVPRYRPLEAHFMISSFLNGKDL